MALLVGGVALFILQPRVIPLVTGFDKRLNALEAMTAVSGPIPAAGVTATPPPPLTIPPSITPSSVPTSEPITTALLTTIESPISAPLEATITITTLSSGLDANANPINTGTQFVAGLPRIYYWVSYRNMLDDIAWSQVLLRDGEIIRAESNTWNQGEEGTTYFWLEAQGGWPAGNYEIQFFIGDRMTDTSTYQMIN